MYPVWGTGMIGTNGLYFCVFGFDVESIDSDIG